MELKLKRIIQALKNSSGKKFFNNIVQALASTIDVDYVFIATIDTAKKTATTLSLFTKGKIALNFTYDLKDTPCANVSNNAAYCVPQNVISLYPKNEFLKNRKIEAYLGSPLQDANGNVLGIIVALSEKKIINTEEITTLFEIFSGRIAVEMQRDKLEISNKIYQERLELALAGSSDGVWDWDLRTNNIYVSPQSKKMLGYEDDEIQDNVISWQKLTHSEDVRGALKKIREYLRTENTETYEDSYRMKHKSGSWAWILNRGKAKFDENGIAIRFSGTHSDVTTQRNLQNKLNELNNTLEDRVKEQTQELKKSENFLNTVINTTKEGIAIMDLKSKFLFVNNAYESITGYTKEELYNKTCIELTIQQDREKSIQIIEQVVHNGYIEQFEKSCITKNGDIIDVEINASLMASKDKLLIVSRDITVQNILKIERTMQENKLLQQSRLAQMGEMIGMIAHQWRQPLSAISATAVSMQLKIELNEFNLKKEHCNKFDNYCFQQLEKIESYVQSLTQTIDDFRNFYRPNKEAQYITFKTVVTKALNIIKNSLESDGINIIQKYDSKKKLLLHANEMMQVILNILHNAQDNFKEKNVINREIIIQTKDNLLILCDNGGGISQTIIDKIFDPYFSTKDEKNGTGLGLYMSKIIVDGHHNGILSVENILDANNNHTGTCFSISTTLK